MLLCYATVPRPSGSAFMSLRKATHRPDPASGVGLLRARFFATFLQSDLHSLVMKITDSQRRTCVNSYEVNSNTCVNGWLPAQPVEVLLNNR